MTNKYGFPGGIIAIAPGGSHGGERKSLVEIKGAVSSIVVPLEPGTGTLTNGNWIPLNHYDHITIHADLATHLQQDGGKSLSLVSPIKLESLIEPVCLVTISAAPEGVTPPYKGRHQKKYERGGAIIGVNPDSQYDPNTTHMFVDICVAPLKWRTNYVPKWPNARTPGNKFGPNIFGPIPAPWAFRHGIVPPVQFWLMLWLAEVPEAHGPIVFW